MSLGTILTRFKLQLALDDRLSGSAALEHDIDDMQNMLTGYLAFARGEGSQEAGTLELHGLMAKLATEAQLRERGFHYSIEGDCVIWVRPGAFSRMLFNLVSNAFRYATYVMVSRLILLCLSGARHTGWETLSGRVA